jgi:3-hydroxyacyl-[acyl-carrier-protein] dehydratase
MTSMRVQIAADHPAFAGHFPGRPLLPGVVLLAEVLEAALADPELARVIGPAPSLSTVKFLAPLGPGAALTIRFESTSGALRFEVFEEARVAASGAFQRSVAAAPADAAATAPDGAAAAGRRLAR